jgi:KDO2-lipid IV(A) lauroyltransferase
MSLLQYILLNLFRFTVVSLPFHRAQRFGKSIGTFMFRYAPVRKKLVMDNLRAAFPKKNDDDITAIALLNYQNIVETFCEAFWISGMDEQRVREVVRIPDSEKKKMDEILGRGKGLIVLSGHITSWELIALAVGLLTGHPLQMIIKKQHNPYVDRMMNALRSKFNNTVVDMDRAPREIIKRLRDGGTVAMLADQSGPEEGLFVNYFGRPTSTHVGPAIFSLRTGAPIMMVYGIRTADGTFDVWFEEVPTNDLQGSDDDKIRTITERHVHLLEGFVRKHPDQWLWMHKRWKHTEKYLLSHGKGSDA